MWWTSCGERTLEGAEAKLFAEALLDLLDEGAPDQFEDYDLGIEAFDTLTYGQKISVLSTIGSGLLKRDVPRAELTAVLEGAIGAVFEHLRHCITVEMDEPELGTAWREKVIFARKEAGGEDLPLPSCGDPEEWDVEVQELADAVLWDSDYEDGHLYVDQPPEKAAWMRQKMRVREDYFLAIADDLSEAEAQVHLRGLTDLCQATIQS